MGILSLLFSPKSMKVRLIEKAIEYLGREGGQLGTAVKEISYDDVVSYMRGPNCRPINSIKDPLNGWVDFEAIVNGRKYIVTVCRALDGFGSVLTAKQA